MTIEEHTDYLLGLSGVSALEFPDAQWQKATFSNSQGNCVEFARLAPDVVAMRDSKNPTGPVLVFERDVIAGFVRQVRGGLLDEFLEA
ncbi:DUF397 domain-containing protein [Nonomuraea jabiensis]|uniref:DUF397 domain-containing protein n=1 Tax=Nonomuraea jabiensis TaxID=882448 RepID=UPI003448DA28